MPWTELSVMDNRLCFVSAWLRNEAPVSVLCAQHGISRKTGHKWLARYQEAGAAGLEDQSRARLTRVPRIDPETAEVLRALRQRRPTWGPRKLLARLALDQPDRNWPAASTLGDLLRRAGLSQPRTRRPREPAPTHPQIAPSAPNESWAADFKGWFRTADGVRCEPFTVTDGYSRYLLACEAVPRLSSAAVMPILTRLFQAHGLPRALRTDNGSPFAHRPGLGGLSRLSVWLLKLDIWPDRIAPGRPDQNGRHERMHRTLDEDAANPPAATLAAQQARLDAWRQDYNMERPHEALGQRCPATLWQPSPRQWPAVIAAWDYPPDHHVRRVNKDGYIKWRDGEVHVTEALRGEMVALARRDDGDWALRFRAFDLAVLGEATNALRRSGLARRAGAAASPCIASRDEMEGRHGTPR
jgi:transposase InsO family protein